LAEVDPRTEAGLRGATKKPLTKEEAKGKIVEFSFWMMKEGYAESTIELRTGVIKLLIKNGVNIYDPEEVKRFIAMQKGWSNGRKRNVAYAYDTFLRMEGISWNMPRYKSTSKMPFIPLEEEIDQLIAGCGKVMAAFLQGLKETGADPGELLKIEWSDVDFKKKVVRINHPVKGHNPRILPISDKWINMLSRLPKKSDRIFNGTPRGHALNFRRQRNRLAVKLNNPRLKKITFRTLRHWKGTMEYHRTLDAKYVQKILGHKSLQSTEIYINIEQALFQNENDEFHVKVARKADEAAKLVEVGFEYVCTTPDNLMIFRKRK